MEVVAPREVAAAPLALCPRFKLLAARDADETGATRVDILRLLRPTGDDNVGNTLQVDCFHRAPGLTSLAWSSNPTKSKGDEDDEDDEDDDTALLTLEDLLYPAGILAGGFNDGAVRLWNPSPACDLNKFKVPKKPKATLILNQDPERARTEESSISEAISNMYSELGNISWTCSKDKEFSQPQDKEDLQDWENIGYDADILGYDIITKEEPVVMQHKAKQMDLILETHDISGPVLGLSFNEVHRYLIAAAGKGDRIFVHDLHHPIKLCKKREVREGGSSELNVNRQTTCLEWSKIYPCTMASSGDAGFLKLWDVRTPQACTTFKGKQDKICTTDLEWSWNNPWHLAVSSLDNEKTAAVKIWDLRNYLRPLKEYGSGASSGVLSLSWNRSGQLLASHQNGSMSCYDPYQNKMIEEMSMESVHCDLGSTWSHSRDTVATFSSKYGLKLSDIGWLLQSDLRRD